MMMMNKRITHNTSHLTRSSKKEQEGKKDIWCILLLQWTTNVKMKESKKTDK